MSAFDPATIDDEVNVRTRRSIGRGAWIAWCLAAIALAGSHPRRSVVVRRRLRSRPLAGESAARRYAARSGSKPGIRRLWRNRVSLGLGYGR